MSVHHENKLPIQWPWGHYSFSGAEQAINGLKQNLPSDHPILQKNPFPEYVRKDTEDEDMFIAFGLSDGGYAVVHFKQHFDEQCEEVTIRIAEIETYRNRMLFIKKLNEDIARYGEL